MRTKTIGQKKALQDLQEMKEYCCDAQVNSVNKRQEVINERYYRGNQWLDRHILKDMQEIMKENTEAFALIQSAKTNQTWAMVLGTAGGALVGFPIGTAIGGGDPEWALAGAGAALIVASIPIVKGFNRKTKKAVELYNDAISSTSYKFRPSFNLEFRGTNLGISMNF